MVKSAIHHVQRGFPVSGDEAMAIVALLQFAENLQFNLKSITPEILYPCSGSGGRSIVEPLSAIPLNDELQQAKAEADVLLKITEKMQVDIGTIENLFNNMIQLDVVGIRRQINARATYSLSFGGTCPHLFLPEAKDGGLALDALLGNQNSMPSYHIKRKWTLYIPKAYHPLLIQQHWQTLQKAMKDVSNATSVSHAWQLGHNTLLDP
ncbi:hypothetical protein U1Q18_017703 [Sarracenia purpurea var. burkii]